MQQNEEYESFLDESQKQELEAMLEGQKPEISAMAVAILKRDSSGYPYEEILLEPDTSMTPKRSPVKKETDNTIYFRLFPNPANDYVTVAYDSGEEIYEVLWLEMYDSGGKRVLQKEIPAGRHEHLIPLAGFKSGVYMFRILADGKSLAAEKLNILK